MLADPQCIYLQYTMLTALQMPPGDCSACSSSIENSPSSQTFIRTQGECTVCTKHSSKFCPQEVIAFNKSKVSVCCLICRLSIFDDHYFYWPFKKFIYLFSWAGSSLLSMGPSSCGERGAALQLRCSGFSLWWPLLLQSMGFRHMGFSSCGVWAQLLWLTGSVIFAHRPSCSAACGILLDHGSNPCPLHWQVDYQPLDHQGRLLLLTF